jgi:hypothetical protein
MKKFSVTITVLIVFSLVSFNTYAKKLIREFKGSDNQTTAEFVVKAPWIADWRVSGDYPGQMAVAINLLSSPSGEYLGKIAVTKYVDNGVKLFDEGGTYRFQVNSTFANWTIRVEELTREEADAYTPVKGRIHVD